MDNRLKGAVLESADRYNGNSNSINIYISGGRIMNITIGGMGNSTVAGIMQNAQISTSENQKKTKEETEIKQSQVNYDYVSTDGDTLQISEAGKSASKGNENQTDSGNTGAQAQSSFAGSSTKQLENVDVNTSTNASSSSTSSTADLSSYSESELKKMYLNGEITKAQYDEEISSRDTDE